MLILHLKRFKMTTNEVYKMNNNINFPLYGLNLEPHVAFPKNESYLYDLYGVVNHYGTMGGGHYTSYVKRMGDWFDYNDSSVTQVTESQVKSNAAYILFYRRRDLEKMQISQLVP